MIRFRWCVYNENEMIDYHTGEIIQIWDANNEMIIPPNTYYGVVAPLNVYSREAYMWLDMISWRRTDESGHEYFLNMDGMIYGFDRYWTLLDWFGMFYDGAIMLRYRGKCVELSTDDEGRRFLEKYKVLRRPWYTIKDKRNDFILEMTGHDEKDGIRILKDWTNGRLI